MRVARHALVLAVATLLAVAYGTRHEGRPPDAAPRRFSLLRQGAACLRRLWARVWLLPTPGPARAADLHCLSPPAT